MNIEELNYQILVMQAYKEGKKIMVKNKRYLPDAWIDIDPRDGIGKTLII